MIRVALIDDHESVRLGLAAAIRRAGWEAIYAGASVADFLAWRQAEQAPAADVVLLDLTLGDGTTVTENVARLARESSVIIHSVADRPSAVREALVAGAAGVVSKASPLDDVIDAVGVVARGDQLNNVEWASAVEGDRAFADAQLSIREREVLRMYAAGLPLKAVAERLGVAYSTAKENVTRVRVKYTEVGRPAPTKVDLLRRAVEDGLVDGLSEDPPRA
ncbi:MAG: response regulator transcription factor [Microbacterium sp.]